MKLNKKQILKIQKNRDPYLLIDCATKVIPGLSIEGYKILKKNEWFSKSIGLVTQTCLGCYK